MFAETAFFHRILFDDFFKYSVIFDRIVWEYKLFDVMLLLGW